MLWAWTVGRRLSASRRASRHERRDPRLPGALADASPRAPCGRLGAFTPAWCTRHLPLVDAAMELLEADDVEFARRCQLMRDEDGRAMLGELAGQLQRLGSHIADVPMRWG